MPTRERGPGRGHDEGVAETFATLSAASTASYSTAQPSYGATPKRPASASAAKASTHAAASAAACSAKDAADDAIAMPRVDQAQSGGAESVSAAAPPAGEEDTHSIDSETSLDTDTEADTDTDIDADTELDGDSDPDAAGSTAECTYVSTGVAPTDPADTTDTYALDTHADLVIERPRKRPRAEEADAKAHPGDKPPKAHAAHGASRPPTGVRPAEATEDDRQNRERWIGEPVCIGDRGERFYQAVDMAGEHFHTGDDVVMAGNTPTMSMVGRIISLWQTLAGDAEMELRWYYAPEETTSGRMPGEVHI